MSSNNNMVSLENFYSEEDKKICHTIVNLYNNREFDKAIKIINSRLEELEKCLSKEDYYLKSELAGFLIDIGEEGRIKEAVVDGLKIIEQERENLNKIIKQESIEYNLGNAKSSIFKILKETVGFKYNPENVAYIIEAKNHYWKAYKFEGKNTSKFRPELVVNLANSLSNCGRIVEALQYYDLVLREYPDFPNANASRAKELLWFKKLTGGYTKNLIYQAKEGYEKASKTTSTNVPEWLKEVWKQEGTKCSEILRRLDFNETNIHKDLEETKKEFESLSPYRKFCITNHLTLSEHSLYCNCIGARRDDIIICVPFEPFDADFIPLMEKILNRLKSEFSLARLLYYYSLKNIENEFTFFDSEVMFTELHDAESIGTKPEMVRTSFRLCFGILDKIASAVCTLFDLADEKENIYFEKFWKPSLKKGTLKQKTRWQKINSIKNVSLLALYTQATDLNNENGEWFFFKRWRNALEHSQLNLLSDKELADDIFGIYKSNPNLLIADENYFRSKTLQMLQFTRSAIFNYVYLVRNEARKTKPKEGRFIKHTFKFKNDSEGEVDK
jgi:tetratricopeptide (TPR) repeat protein